MLRTVPMKKIRIVALKSAEYDTIQELQSIGAMEIRKSAVGLEDDKALGQITDVSELLVKFRSALSYLKEPNKPFKLAKQLKLKELIAHCRAVKEVDEVNELVETRRVLSESGKKGTREVAKIDKLLEKIGSEHYFDIAGLAEMLQIEYERSQISSSFKNTLHTFIVEGWIPKRRLGELNKRLDNVTKQNFVLEEVNDGEVEPTMMSRPKAFSPFDYLVGFYSLPRSDEIDPTWLFIASFVIFYGMMVSDFGYGVLSLIFATVLIKKFPEEGLLNSVAKVWQLASVPIMIFGILSNQFFGFTLAPFNKIMIFDWTNNVPALIAITILMGIAQVIIGLAIGFVNKYRHHEYKLAITKITSIIVVVTGTIAIAGGLFGYMSSYAMPAAIVAIVSSVVTVALSGIEAVEFMSLVSQPLSYTRIFGFGLASIILAALIDKAFTPTFTGSIVGVIMFVVVAALFVLLHSMNMLLSIFEGMVQATRLNFVEFFTKFYTGGGEKFSPYHFTRRYTKE